ncbi:hypothetical protein F5Y10DRAFT_66252 [Nemania abortiva]|nr:hypothetical protein F5Y10DRAFT_66252 [Nemania abortiva]
MHVTMSGRRASSDLSVVSYDDDLAPQTDQFDSHRHARPMTRPGSRRTQPPPQQPWYPQPYSYYPQYPGPVPLVDNNLAAYPHFAAQQAAASRWDGLDFLDEEEQERRKKGKELIPVRPMMNGPVPLPWAAYPGGYGQGAYYGPMGNPLWPTLPPPQQAPVPLLTFPSEQYTRRKPGKHVHHYDELQGTGRRRTDRSPTPEITVNRDIDGILTPDSGDLTVHLTMDLEEDLEEHLDELNRLSRLGHFSLAKDFFNENLQHHIDNPYVLVQYADLLLHQGDFKGVTLLKDDPIFKREGEQSNSEELRILRVYWELLQILAKSYTLDTLSGVTTVLEEAANVLNEPYKDGALDRPISSTEIQILALTIRLTGHPVLNSKWLKYGGRALAPFSTSLSRLYQTLLRQGRIWDFHDLVVLMPTIEDTKAFTYDIFGKDLVPSLQTMVSDWSDSVHGYDASTTLGLLSIMTHPLLEPVEISEKECIDILKLCLPLAISVVENDASSLKSRPYLRLLLAKSRFAETASRQAIESLKHHLQSSQGVYYQSDIALLPVYVPSGNETPQWTPVDQPSELKDPVKLVLRSAIELGDMGTEAIARRELIRLSAHPRDEFDLLCNLQMSRQGDLNGYGLSLASKYLVSNTKEAKEELAISISRLLSRVASTDYWDPSHEWILNMLLYKLEGRSPSTIQHMIERSHSDYHHIEESLLREISRKMPTLKDWVDQQQLKNPTHAKLKETVLRASSTSRRSNKSTARSKKSPALRRSTVHISRPITRNTEDGRREERDVPLMSGSKPEGDAEQSRPLPDGQPPTDTVHNGERAAPAVLLNNDPETPVFSPRSTPRATYIGPDDIPEDRRVPPPSSQLVTVDIPATKRRQEEEETNAEQIRQKWEAEFNKRLEVEKESERQRRNERMAILEGFKRQVEAIRKEAVEQAERKNRVEAEERAEQLNWEREMEERKLEKEVAMATAEANTVKLEAKFEAVRKAAIEEAEKKMREESEMQRKKKENDARRQAELEIQERLEAEKKADEELLRRAEIEIQKRLEAERREFEEEAEAAERLREEQQRKAEVEEQKRQTEARAFEAAMKQAEEEEYREKIREWAAERAEKDLEIQNQIHLKDAVGRKYAIPFAQGRTWESMRELIDTAFRHVDIVGPEVLEGHYDLVGPDGTIILPQTWDQIIQPGWDITMLMWPPMQQPEPEPPQELNAQPAGAGASVPPPPPPNWNANDDEVASEPDVPIRNSGEDAVSTVDGTSIEEVPLSRPARIVNAWVNLKDKVLRRKRRNSWSTTNSSIVD